MKKSTLTFVIIGSLFFITAQVSAQTLKVLPVTVTNAVHCYTTCDGSLTANPTGGTPPYTYVWSISPSQPTQTVTGICPGNVPYYVADAMGAQAAGIATVLCATGISEYELNSLLDIYPNPSKGKFTLSSEISKGEITIYSVHGEKVYSSSINENKSEIDLLNQRNGVYFLQLKTAEGIATKKIIIQH